MSYGHRFEKSLVHATLEGVLQQKSSRFDSVARANRAKAAALIECAEKGYAKLTMGGIAKRARVSTASLYSDYKDRDALLIQAIELVLSILAEDTISLSNDPDPFERVKFLLGAHGRAYGDVFAQWLFRLHIDLAWSGHSHLFGLARVVQDKIETIWDAFWLELMQEGYLVATRPRDLTAILLGAIERQTIIAGLLFGEPAVAGDDLDTLVETTALSLFRVWGTQKFWHQRSPNLGPHPEQWAAQPCSVPGLVAPVMLAELPSRRLAAYAEEVTARTYDRLDAKGRRIRVQLAALLECQDLGYGSASMSGVAHRAGVSTATLYRDYETKQELFTEALAKHAITLADYGSHADATDRPQQSIANQLFTHAAMLADPDFGWFHHATLATEISDTPALIQASTLSHQKTEELWTQAISSFEQRGVFHGASATDATWCDHHHLINILFGGLERNSLLAHLFFGKTACDLAALGDLARAVTEFVFRLQGASEVLTLNAETTA
jgi:AcrR family transcriptional regulator